MRAHPDSYSRYLYAVWGKQKEARQILEESQRAAKDHYVSSYPIAMIYVGLGENDKAFEWLGKSLQERDNSMVFINVDQRLDHIRSDPRFAKSVRGNGLAAVKSEVVSSIAIRR